MKTAERQIFYSSIADFEQVNVGWISSITP